MIRERKWRKKAEKASWPGGTSTVGHPSNVATGMGAKVEVSSDWDMLEILGADNRREVKKPEKTALRERVQQKD